MSSWCYTDVYVDGCCLSNGQSYAKAGIGVFFGNDHPLNVSEPCRGRATNNCAEIEAVTRAAEICRYAGYMTIRIHTDSEFVINCDTKWMDEWKRNNWTTSNGNPVKNKYELQEMDEALGQLRAVQWVHVRGHQGNYGNMMADRLAREGAKRYVPR